MVFMELQAPPAKYIHIPPPLCAALSTEVWKHFMLFSTLYFQNPS